MEDNVKNVHMYANVIQVRQQLCISRFVHAVPIKNLHRQLTQDGKYDQ